MTTKITPRTLKGFRDYLPAQQAMREACIHSISKLLRKRGFLPIDTPTLEYTDILLGKGGGESDKQIYRFNDHGGRDIALRYDLTVPLARFVSEHLPLDILPLPFMVYNIGKVFRGENSQRGRYREFTQCDFDILGSDSLAADCNILLTVVTVLGAILPLLNPSLAESGSIHFFHRKLVTNLLDALGVTKNQIEILRIVDKSSKIGESNTRSLLNEFLTPLQCDDLLHCLSLKGSPHSVLAELGTICTVDQDLRTRLENTYDLVQAYIEQRGLALSCVMDMRITRGLDYYTGLVFECFVSDASLGSVCSGGRYDNLVGLFSKKVVSGVGGSLGLDRILECVDESALARLNSGLRCVVSCDNERSMPEAFSLITKIEQQLASEKNIQSQNSIHVYPFVGNTKKLSSYLTLTNTDLLISLPQQENVENVENTDEEHLSSDSFCLVKFVGKNSLWAEAQGLPLKKTQMTVSQLYKLIYSVSYTATNKATKKQ